MDCILYPEQYTIIYNVSFLSLGTSIYAVYNGYYGLSIYPGGVFLTSINYWRKPDYSWRRYVDMTYVSYAVICQSYKAYCAQYMLQYYALVLLAISFYPLGVYYYNRKLWWHSTYAHCTLHIIANIANLVLYSGKIL
jgi:hypothetical protein